MVHQMETGKSTMTDLQLYGAMIEKYGDTQIVVAIEELSELSKELTKYLRHQGNFMHIAEEIADVEIMVEQIKQKWNLTANVVVMKHNKKLRMSERYLKDEIGGDTV